MATPAVEWNTTHWVPDEAVSECAAPTCGRPFNRLLRKHHCRRCGRVFCAQCTSHKLHLTPQLAVDSERGVAVRVCVGCYDECATASTSARAGLGPEQALDDEQLAPARDWTAALVRARAKHAAQARLDIADALHRWERACATPLLARPLPGAVAARAAAEESGVRWEEDNSRLDCPHCNVHFSAFTRRHHCRLCGSLCCSDCSHRTAVSRAPAGRGPAGGGPDAAGCGFGAARASTRVAGALVAAASASVAAAGLPPPSVRSCARCAALLARHAAGVAHADALAAVNESALVRAYAQLAAARAAISEQLGLYARAVSRLDLALDPSSLGAELARREQLLAQLLPKAMSALKALAAAPTRTPADARVAAQAKAMAIAFLQGAAPRFHALKRAAELKLAQARDEQAAALHAKQAMAAEAAAAGARPATNGGNGGPNDAAAAAAEPPSLSEKRHGHFLARVIARTRGAAAAAAATPAMGNMATAMNGVTSAAVGTLTDLVPARGGAVLARLLPQPAAGAPTTAAVFRGAAVAAGCGGGAWAQHTERAAELQLPTSAHLDTLTRALVLISRLSLSHADAASRLGLSRALGEVVREIHAEVAFWAEERGEDVGARDAAITADVTAAAADDVLAPMGGGSLVEQLARAGQEGGGVRLEDGDAAVLGEMALVVGGACSLVETEVPEAASASSRAALCALRQQLKATCAARGHTASPI